MSNLRLFYRQPAPDSDEGWERRSLPIGNGYFGANVFGLVGKERIQITENTVENPGRMGGLTDFIELYLRFPHGDNEVSAYERGLDIGDSFAFCRYRAGDTAFERTCFCSYPDRVLVIGLSSDGPEKLSFTVAPEIPFLTEEEGRRKTGETVTENDTLILRGTLHSYRLHFEAQVRVFATGGSVTYGGKTIRVADADRAYVLLTCATNYELSERIFLEDDPTKKLRDFDPHDLCSGRMEHAAALSFDTLLERHRADYHDLFDRVSLRLGTGDVPADPTDVLLEKYKNGDRSRYLETLYFQYGRYLLISSSRKNTLPANLQGTWNCHDRSPWGSGYWHNINIQMNYWPTFSTGLTECFNAYLDFNRAFRPAAQKRAKQYVKDVVPENYTGDGDDYGWTIGTGNYAYCISGPDHCSGVGACGLTTKLFWDLWDFTRDEKILRDVVYPTLLGTARFLERAVADYDGKYLSVLSESPEQIIDNIFSDKTQYYLTVGSAFDQEMMYENGRDLLACADILGIDSLPEEDRKTIATLRERIERFDPIQVGWSGQIKEFREEKFYGEIGEYHHRHISHLVGLYPGTQISGVTPAWLDAARVSLNKRGDRSTGWALAHRLNAWARLHDGNRALRLLNNLIGERTFPNLWDAHPPFQIDGNFGGTSGISEMLLQSHEGYLSPLCSLPDEWSDGAFKGLRARGGFTVDVTWSDSCMTGMTVLSTAGERCVVKYPRVSEAKQLPAGCEIHDNDMIAFGTVAGETYRLSGIPARHKMPVPTDLTVTKDLELTWKHDGAVRVWRALESEPTYHCIAENVTGGTYRDDLDFSKYETVTYKITRADVTDVSLDGTVATVNHATRLDLDRSRYLIQQINLPCGGI